MRVKQLILTCLLLIALVGCVEVVSAEDSSSAALTTNSLVPVISSDTAELNNYSMYIYPEAGGSVKKVSPEVAVQVVFFSLMSYEPHGKSLFVIASATVEDEPYIAIIDIKNLKGQFSKGGIANVWTGVDCYQVSQSVDVINYKTVTKEFMDQRKFLPQGRGIVLLKVLNSKEKTE